MLETSESGILAVESVKVWKTGRGAEAVGTAGSAEDLGISMLDFISSSSIVTKEHTQALVG